MNKLFLLFLLIIPHTAHPHKRRQYRGYQQRLREERTVQDSHNYTLQEAEDQFEQLSQRKKYLKSQIKSSSAQAFYCMKYGVSFLFIGIATLFLSYQTTKTLSHELFYSPSRFIFNTILTSLGTETLIKGVTGMYSNLCYWKQHRNQKLITTREALTQIGQEIASKKSGQRTVIFRF